MIDKMQLILELFGAGDLESARKIVEGYRNKFPTVEPESRPKGKWNIKYKNIGDYSIESYECSNCMVKSNYTLNYCPECGADMRGEE